MTPRICFSISPVENPTVENLRLALYSWAATRALDGDLILRIDDTILDPLPATRSERDLPMVEALEWLNIDWDEGVEYGGDFEPYVLSKRNGRSLQTADEEMHITHRVVVGDVEAETAVHLIHLPLLITADGNPLPQRGYALEDLQNGGYLPKAIFNYLALLGWQPESGQEILDKWQVRKQFKIEQIATEPVVFDWAQLKRINAHYIQQLSSKQLAEEIRPFLEDAYGTLPIGAGWLERVTAVIKPQLQTLEDAIELAEWALSDDFELSDSAVISLETPQAHAILSHLVAEVATVVLLDQQTAQTILNGLSSRLAEQHNWQADQITLPIRSALIGQTEGADLALIMGILGKQTTLQRLAHALR